MALKTTPLSKCLDKKTLILGFEMADLLIVFLFLSVLNVLFGQTDQKFLLVWLPPALLAGVLRLGKKGKPDDFLVHFLRFQFSPGVYSAFTEPKEVPKPPSTKRGGAN